MIESLTLHFRQDPELREIDPVHLTRTDELDGVRRILVRGGDGVLHGERVAKFHGLAEDLGKRSARVSADDLFDSAPGALVAFEGWLPVVTTHEDPRSTFVVVRHVALVERNDVGVRSDAMAVAR